ncbi:hypothetical protein CR513_09626, partial [Mucuna pruriens]
MGAAKQILVIRIICDRQAKKLWLSKKHYVKRVLRRFHMENAKRRSTLLATHFKLSSRHSPSNKVEKTNMSKVPYAFVVGSLMHAMVRTGPDIAHVVCTVSTFLSNPGKENWNAGSLGDKPTLVGYSNSDMVGDIDSKKSTSDYLIKSKHIDVRYHWIRDALDAKLLKLAKVHTDENGVDMMTKVLPRGKFEACEIAGLSHQNRNISFINRWIGWNFDSRFNTQFFILIVQILIWESVWIDFFVLDNP